MTDQHHQPVPDCVWGERCAIKLDMLMTRMDRVTGLLFCLKSTFTVEDAAMYLGLTPEYMRKITHDLNIPHSKPTGGRIYYNKETLDAWLRDHVEDFPDSLTPVDAPPQVRYCG